MVGNLESSAVLEDNFHDLEDISFPLAWPWLSMAGKPGPLPKSTLSAKIYCSMTAVFDGGKTASSAEDLRGLASHATLRERRSEASSAKRREKRGGWQPHDKA